MFFTFVQNVGTDRIAPRVHDHDRQFHIHARVNFAALDGLFDHHLQRLRGFLAIDGEVFSVIQSLAKQHAGHRLGHARVGGVELHTCFHHPAEILEGVQVVTRRVFVLEVSQLLLLDHREQVHEHILFIFEVLVETAFRNPAILDDPIRGSVLQTVLGELIHGGADNFFAFLFGEIEKGLFGHIL